MIDVITLPVGYRRVVLVIADPLRPKTPTPTNDVQEMAAPVPPYLPSPLCQARRGRFSPFGVISSNKDLIQMCPVIDVMTVWKPLN